MVLEEQEAGLREEEDRKRPPQTLPSRLQKISFTIFNQPLRLSQKGSLFQIKDPVKNASMIMERF